MFTLFDGVSFTASLASLVLSVLAIWLAFMFKREADKVNTKTLELLVDIRTDARSIVGGIMQEFHAQGEWMRSAVGGNQVTGGGVSVGSTTPSASAAPSASPSSVPGS